MNDPVRHRGFLCAAQQGPPRVATSPGQCALGAFWRRAAVVLLGAALLGAASAVHEFELRIVERRVEGGASTLRVNRGETVVLRWRTDEAVSLHVHGYDLKANLSPAAPASMRFEAGVAGRFAITAHEFGALADQSATPKKHREVTLLYHEVLPK
jgi:hypothetical protein